MPIAVSRSLRHLIANVPLRWMLTVPFVLPTIGAVALVGYLSYRSGEEAVTDLANQLMQEKGNQTVLYLKRSLEVPHLVNQLNADKIRLGQLPGFESTDPTPLENFFWTQLQRFPDVTSIAMANERGGMVGAGRRLVPGPETMNVYRTPQFARGRYTLSITNADGKMIETKTIVENYDARTRPWYTTPAKAGEATWSAIYQYISDLQVLGISAGLPVYTEAGNLRGILTADVNLTRLSNFLAGLNLSRSGQVFIVERSGLLVASSTNQPIARIESGKAERINAGESDNPAMQETMAQLSAQFGNLSQIDAIQQFTIRQSQSSKWVRVIPFQDRYGLDWLIVLMVPESDFMGAIRANQATTLSLSLLTLGGAIGLGLVAANRLNSRFAQLSWASRELAAGKLDHRLPTDGAIAELNGLAHSFNQMADQLQQSFDGIKTALTESKEKFTTIFRTSPEAIAIASYEGLILEANDSFLQYSGYSQPEIIGKTALELNMWGDLTQRDRCRALLDQFGSVQNLEAQARTQSGEIKTVLLSAEVLMLEGQKRILIMLRDISDRKIAELALQQSEARYRAIVEDQTEIICRSLPDTSLTFVNDAYCRFYGVRREDIIGRSFRQLIFEPDQKTVVQRISSLSLEQPTMISENRAIVNGQVRWVQWCDRLLFDAQGNVAEIQSSGRDISALKQTEESLQEREAMLRAIGDNLSKGYIYQCTYDSDIRAQYLYVSAGVERLLGLKPEDLMRDPGIAATVGFEADLAAAKQIIREAIQHQKPFELQMRNRTASGKVQWSSIRETPLQLEDGRIVWNGVETDITDLKQIEAALRESEERFRLAFDDAPIGMSLVSPSGQYVRVNRSFCNLLEYSLEELYALTFRGITHPEDLEADWQSFQQVLRGEIGAYQMQKRYISSQGVVIPVLLNAAPIRDETGTVLYVVGHIQDIRDRLAVDRLKDEFISVVSHELRTPLTSIRGALGILDSGVFRDRPQQAEQMLKIALNNSDRLVRLVNDILTLERLQSGKMPLILEPCRVSDLMQQAIDSVQALADQSSIILAAAPVSATVLAEADAIVQVLVNLLSNAIKFSAQGDRVCLKAELQKAGEEQSREQRAGEREGSTSHSSLSAYPSSLLPACPSTPLPAYSHILFTIADQGRGIPADKLETIFEQFQQVDVSDSRQKGGTGLGLTICRKIVQEHGGRIWAESVPGEGSTFYFTLPIGNG